MPYSGAQVQRLGRGYRRVAHTQDCSLLLCFTQSQTFQHLNTPLPSGSFTPSNLHSSSQPKSLHGGGDSCTPVCSRDPFSARETERKALERRAGSCSQHHARVSASYCTKWTTHTHYLQPVFHMMEQLLARSFLISVSLSKSVLPGICDARFSPRLELLRFKFLCTLLTEASVVT